MRAAIVVALSAGAFAALPSAPALASSDCKPVQRAAHNRLTQIHVKQVTCDAARHVLAHAPVHRCPSGWTCTHHQIDAFSWKWYARRTTKVGAHQTLIWVELRRS